MADKKKTRKWVVRAIVAFLAILLILTFFSNTIMNATIPKVVAESATWGNLSFQTTAKATIEIENKTPCKVPEEINGRKVASVDISNYDEVHKGTVCITLEPAEDSEELETMKEQYEQQLKDKGYEEREPSHAPDYTTYEQSITSASAQVQEAQQALNDAKTKDERIAAAKNIIATNQPSLIAAQADVEAISNTIEEYNSQLTEINYNISVLEVVVDERYLESNVPEEGFADPTLIDPENPGDVLLPPEPGSNEEKLWGYYAQRDEITPLIDAANTRLSDASAKVSSYQAAIDSAQAVIDAAGELPSVSQAQSDLNSASAQLNSAQQQLSDQKINDGIQSDKMKDAKEKRDKELEKSLAEIEKLEKNLAITEIEIPADGTIYDCNINVGDTLVKDDVLFNVVPDDMKCTASFTFSTEDAKAFYVGMELEPQDGWYDSCQVISIKPSENDPRNSRVVKCLVTGDYIFPGEEITVLAAKSNKNYENIVPSSAVNSDNNGNFVYALVESSTPLGTKYTVKRIEVEIEDTDGSRTAIKSDKLKDKNYQFITRSEEPLQDGDRVRLQDYSKKEQQ